MLRFLWPEESQKRQCKKKEKWNITARIYRAVSSITDTKVSYETARYAQVLQFFLCYQMNTSNTETLRNVVWGMLMICSIQMPSTESPEWGALKYTRMYGFYKGNKHHIHVHAVTLKLRHWAQYWIPKKSTWSTLLSTLLLHISHQIFL